MAAVDILREGLLMAPVSAIPRLLARHGLKFNDIELWEIHEAFSRRCSATSKDSKMKTSSTKKQALSIHSEAFRESG